MYRRQDKMVYNDHRPTSVILQVNSCLVIAHPSANNINNNINNDSDMISKTSPITLKVKIPSPFAANRQK